MQEKKNWQDRNIKKEDRRKKHKKWQRYLSILLSVILMLSTASSGWAQETVNSQADAALASGQNISTQSSEDAETEIPLAADDVLSQEENGMEPSEKITEESEQSENRVFDTEGQEASGNVDLNNADSEKENSNSESSENTGNENTGNENTGNENTGNENTGNENTGNENTGNENTGNENTGNENTGNENTGNENTGNENTGNENIGNESTGNENTENENIGNEDQQGSDKEKTPDSEKNNEVIDKPTDETEDKKETEEETNEETNETEKESGEEELGKEESDTESSGTDGEEDGKGEESEKKNQGASFSWDDGTVKITVFVSDVAQFPENAELKAAAIAPGTDDYLNAVAKIKAANGLDDEAEIECAPYDIYFLSDGQRVEPADGTVQVTIEFTAPVLGETEGEVVDTGVAHIKESGAVEQLSASVDINEEGEVVSADFITDSFSIFAVYTISKAEQAAGPVTSSSLNSFLKNADVTGATTENGKLVLAVGSTYSFKLTFQENKNQHFDKTAELVYEVPTELVPTPANGNFDMDIKIGTNTYKVSGNTYRMSDNKIYVKFNENDPNFTRLKNVDNAMFYLEFSAKVDETASGNKQLFGDSVDMVVSFNDKASISINKLGSYNKNTGKFNYTVTVTSAGTSKNVVIKDNIAGTLLIYDKNLTASSSIPGKTVDGILSGVSDNGFTYTIPSMNDKETVTLNYSASIDFSKLGGKLFTANETKNTVTAKGENTNEVQAAKHFNGTKAYDDGVKKSGSLGASKDGKQTINWTITINPDAAAYVGGRIVTDTLKQNERIPMVYSGEGITVQKYDKSGKKVGDPEQIEWKNLTPFTADSSWSYTIPEETSNPQPCYKYVITYQTEADVSGLLNTEMFLAQNQVKFDNQISNGSLGVKGPSDHIFNIQKQVAEGSMISAEGVNWCVKIAIPKSGFTKSFTITDRLPATKYNGVLYQDTYKKGTLALTMDGVSVPENFYEVNLGTIADSNSIEVVFDFSKQEVQTLFAKSGSPRTMKMTYTTVPAPGWPMSSLHMNAVEAVGDGTNTSIFAYYSLGVPKLEKKYAGIEMIDDLPAFKFQIYLLNVAESPVTVTDEFDTSLFEVYKGKITVGASDLPVGASRNNTGGKAYFTPSLTGGTFIISDLATKQRGSYYGCYCLQYYLRVKNENALKVLEQMAADGENHTAQIKNKAKWGTSSDEVSGEYTVDPLSKELLEGASSKNNYTAKYRISLNPNRLELNGGESLTVTDTMQENMKLITDSIEVKINGEDSQNYTYTIHPDKTGFTLTVPDKCHVVITYSVKIIGSVGSDDVTYKNYVAVSGGYEDSSASASVTISSNAGGTGSAIALRVIKRDAETSQVLAGAKFKLYKKSADEEEYTVVSNNSKEEIIFETNDKGVVELEGGNDKGWHLYEGDACILKEIEAPSGYQLAQDFAFTVSDVAIGQGSFANGDTIDIFDYPLTEIRGTKTWKDEGDQDGKRPDSITVHLKKGEETVTSKTVKPDENGNWKWSFTGLPKYENGEPISYHVVEEPVEGYTAEYPAGTYDIVNTYIPETIEISGTKIWEDNNNQDGIRPGNITINLLKGEKKVLVKSQVVTADEKGNWDWSFTGLPRYENGKVISYTITETSVDGYETRIEAAEGTTAAAETRITTGMTAERTAGSSTEAIRKSYTITNTHTSETVEISGKKIWDDNNNQDGKRPQSITIRLWNGVNQVRQATVNEEDGWAWKFTNLPKYANGQEITYHITEDPVEGYIQTISGYDVTNSYNPEKTSVNGIKIWRDQNNRDGKRPKSITVALYSQTDSNAEKVMVTELEVKPDKNGNWLWNFTGLPKYNDGKEIIYTVRENQVADYTVQYSDAIQYPAGMQRPEKDYNISNLHLPETVTVSGTKIWEDNNNQDGIRPTSITLYLLKNKSRIQHQTVKPDKTGNWNWSFDGLPKYENGQAIKYTVEEESAAGYDTAIDKVEGKDNTYKITNTHTPETIEISGSKTWEDTNNQDGLRPKSIKIRLLDDTNQVREAIVTAQDNWSWSFKGLPKYRNGQEIQYTISEDLVKGYSQKIEGYNVTNIHIPGKTGVSGRKIWRDQNNRDGIRPDSITVILKKKTEDSDPKVVETRVVTAADDWSWNFANLPEYENGKKIAYTVEEEKVPEGYVVRYSNDIPYPAGMQRPEKDYNISNLHLPETISVSGTKIWNDGDNQDGLRPKSITVRLWKGEGERTEVDTCIATASENWSWSFEGLPKYENGVEIKYTVTEDLPAGYEAVVEAVADNTYKITNTHIPQIIDISGTKIWEDNNNQDGIRPGNITINLLKGEKKEPFRSLVVTADQDGNWRWSFTGLPKYENGEEILYTITETLVEGYETTIEAAGTGAAETTEETTGTTAEAGTGMTAGEGTGATTGTTAGKTTGSTAEAIRNIYTITNTHIPETVEISGSKTWEDNDNKGGKRPQRITVRLWKGEKPIIEKEVTANQDGKWSWSFKDLPKYENGQEIQYVLTEDAIEDYSQKIDGYDITNTYTPKKTNVNGRKIWRDQNNRDGIRPERITVILKKKTESGSEEVVGSQQVTAEDNWSWNFENLDEYDGKNKIIYFVEEEEVPGYEAQYSDTIQYPAGMQPPEKDYNISNLHLPETISISGTKTWNDAGDQDGKRPKSITINLLKDGEEILNQTVTPDETGKWSWNFTDLPKYESGKMISYSISEDPVEGYTAEYPDGTYNVINTHIPETINISGAKTWDDANDQDGKRPYSITVRLWNGEKQAASFTATEETGWKWSFENLPKYEDGQEIQYVLTEDTIEDYSQKIYGYNVTNSYTPGKTSVSGQKIWRDQNNRDGIRPESITVILKKKTANTQAQEVKRLEVTAKDNWSWNFTDLPEYEDGEKIVYSVEEEEVPDGYSVVYSEEGYDITNRHLPEKIDISGTKIWNDANDQDGKRPSGITVNLLKGEEKIQHQVVTADTSGNWNWSFTGLPKYENGVEIQYTITETPVAGYETKIETAAAVREAAGTATGMTAEATRNLYTITNTHIPETVEISGRKTWEHGANLPANYPQSITIRLWKGEEPIEEKKVTANQNGNWSWSFTGLPKYENGQEIQYFITEDAVKDYSQTIEGYNVTNTYTPNTISISGQKIWRDQNNRDGIRPDRITVILKKTAEDGTETEVNSREIMAADNWSWNFTDLPEYDENGEKIVYTVKEKEVPDRYEVRYSKDISYPEGMNVPEKDYNISNLHVPETVTVSGTKTWIDEGDQDGIRPTSITINLLKEGEKILHQTVTEGEDGNWNWKFENLPKCENGQEIKYTVEEVPVEGYTSVIEKVEGNENKYKITNTHKPETIDISGSKVWDDANDRDGLRPATITISLLKKTAGQSADQSKEPEQGAGQGEQAGEPEQGAGQGEQAEEPEQGAGQGEQAEGPEQGNGQGDLVEKKIISAENDWKWSFIGLPKYENGVEISYSIREDEAPGYTTQYHVGSYDVTNTHVSEIIDISGSKTWIDDNDRYGKRPESITIRLLAEEKQVREATVTAENGWSWNFKNLPKTKDGEDIEYTISEDAVSGYSQQVNGYDVTNIYTPGKTSVSGIKLWYDNDNQAKKRPESITVVLKKNGTELQKLKVSEKEDWSWNFSNLPEYENGQKIKYTIEEEGIPKGYTCYVVGYNMANIYDPESDKPLEPDVPPYWPEPNVTPSTDPIPSVTLTPSVTPTPEATPTPEGTPAPEVTPTPEGTPVPEVTPTPEGTPAPEVTPTPEGTPAPEVTPTPEGTPTPEATPTPERTPTPEATPTPEGTSTPEATPTPEGTSMSETMSKPEKGNTSITVIKTLSYMGFPVMAESAVFYAGLYYDSECTRPAAPPQALVFSNDALSEVAFNNLEPGREYYVGECDADGNVIYSGKTSGGEIYHAEFTGTNGNYVLAEKGGNTQIFLDNQMEELPDGFYIAGQLHVTKKLLGTDGMPMNSNKVFYAGIFDDPEYTALSDYVEYNLLDLDLAGGSTAESVVTVSLPTTDSTVTLYVTEVDEDGEPVAGAQDFAYQVSVDGTQQIVSADNLNVHVVITNQEREEESEETEKKKPENNNTNNNAAGNDNNAESNNVKNNNAENKNAENKNAENKNAENKNADTRNVPPTGDETPVLPLAASAVASGFAVVFLLYRRRRSRMQRNFYNNI